MLTKSMRADLGVMISASHNPFADNGIKLFGPDGYKLSDEAEHAIERLGRAEAREIGGNRPCPKDRRRARPLHPVREGRPFPSSFGSTGSSRRRLRQRRGLPRRSRGAVGAGRRGDRPRSRAQRHEHQRRLRLDHPQLLQQTVVESGADIGLALDGDADRLIVVDEKGQLVDGDQLMALIALGLQRGELQGDAVVATVMSNLGLERRLLTGLDLIRTKVGDRYVLEEMRKSGCNVGGEQSGTSS